MTPNPLNDRGRALEEDHFRRVESERLHRLREERRQEDVRRELGAELEVADESLLDTLVGLGVTAETAAAFEALPLVEVAWADGQVKQGERGRVLELAGAVGMEPGGPSHARLEQWLDTRPPWELFEAWRAFALDAVTDPDAARRLRRLAEDVWEVAAASGGLLGLGSISSAEQAAIGRIRSALGAQPVPGP